MRLLSVLFVVLSLSVSLVGDSHAAMEWLKENLEEGSAIGLGVLYSSQPYTDVDADVFPVPLLNVKYKRFYVNGTSLGFLLLDEEEFDISLVGVPRFWGYESDDSSALAGMSERKGSFDGGLRAQWENELFTLEVTGVTDWTGEHEGQEVSALIKHEFLQGGFTPRVGVRWFSDDLTDHYYGVEASEAAAGRPAYEADSTVNFVAGAMVAVPFAEDWAWITDAQYQMLGDEIEDSPIVEENEILTFVSGIVYRF
ncbi:MAG TPA: MipA/OmpV family protein [Candidatus Omnitrophota bacterium]|nr:MipA/OmpV family protein [Candidatus Omnitrophota bacterium]